MLKGLIFDMDGTIVDNSLYHVEAFRQFFQRHGYDLIFTKDSFGRKNEDIFKEMVPEECEKYGWEALSEEKEEIYREISRPKLKAVKGLEKLLEEAKAEDIQCCIGSSAPRKNIEFHMDLCDIRKYMSTYLCSEDVKIGKPNPDVYLQCCKRMNLRPEECIVFEDAEVGIRAGKAAGCKVVGLATWNSVEMLKNETECDLVVNDFTECSIESLKKMF